VLNDKAIGNLLNKPNPKIIEVRINKEKLGIIIFQGTNLSAIQPIEIAVIGLMY